MSQLNKKPTSVTPNVAMVYDNGVEMYPNLPVSEKFKNKYKDDLDQESENTIREVIDEHGENKTARSEGRRVFDGQEPDGSTTPLTGNSLIQVRQMPVL